MNYLYHKKISFIGENNIIFNLSAKDIIEIINQNLDEIILKEIDDYRVINNIDIIMNYNRNNEIDNTNENTNDNTNVNINEESNEESNSEISNNEEEIKKNSEEEKGIVSILKNKILLRILKFNNLCENSKIYKVINKVTILNIFLINCYCNVMILKNTYKLFF